MKTEPKEQEVKAMKTALEVAKTLPCQCSNCGMKETESAKMIKEYAESENEALRQSVREIVEKFEKTCYDPASMYHHIELKSAIERAKQKLTE